MKIPYYSIFDRVSGLYASPSGFVNDETAKRAFSLGISRGQIPAENASDYALYHIGHFDDNSGEFLPEKPRFVIGGTSPAKE